MLPVAVLDTVIFHCAVWPWVKFPEWLFATDSTGAGKIITESVLDVALLAPPPVTETWLGTLVVVLAVGLTFTSIVNGV